MSNVRRKRKRKAGLLCLLVCLPLFSVSGCSSEKITFTDNQVLRVDDRYMTQNQAMVLLCGLQKKYENTFGSEAGSLQFGNATLNQYIKEQVKNQLVQLAGLNELAETRGIVLNEEEMAVVKEAAEAFINSFTKEQQKAIGIKKADVQELYKEYATAEKVYQQITEDVKKEISDDQARMIDIQVIFFAFPDEEAETQSALEARNLVNATAYQVWERIAAGESFESLAAEYNNGTPTEYRIGRGEMEEAFEEAAFQLTSGQVSGLVEGKDGIYIIKCISNYNQEETDANKEKIYMENCSEIFNKEYNKFLKKAKVKLNDKAWEKVNIVSGAALPDVDFLSIYENISGTDEAE